MKILLGTHRYFPDVGGIEEVSDILATEFVRAGHEVKVVTQSPSVNDDPASPFEVVRRPGPSRLLQLVRWCDVYFQNNISLQTAWPLLVCRRPWVIAHHTWIKRVDGRVSGRDRLKRALLKRAANVSVSRAIAADLPVSSAVIGNPYRDDTFVYHPNAQREGKLIFVGRLVSDKGVDLLLDALSLLQQEGLKPLLTVVGAGPEEEKLRARGEASGVQPQVNFASVKRGAELANLLNQHQILVIPSRWEEPFGIVALEAIACGCVVVGANAGGLPDAIGPAGVLYEPGNLDALVSALRRLLLPGANLDPFRQHAGSHLGAHAARAVAVRYLAVLEGAAG